MQIVSTQPHARCKGKVIRASTTSMTNESSTSVLEGGLTACLGKLRDRIYVRALELEFALAAVGEYKL